MLVDFEYSTTGCGLTVADVLMLGHATEVMTNYCCNRVCVTLKTLNEFAEEKLKHDVVPNNSKFAPVLGNFQ